MTRYLVILAVIPALVLGGCQPKIVNVAQPGGASASISEGGESSGGGETPPAHYGSAWFLGNRPVRYCVNRVADFKISESVVLKTVQEAVGQWVKYYRGKVRPGVEVFRQLNSDQNRDIDFISTDFVFVQSCDSTVDLRFEIGTKSAEILKLAKRMNNPWGFAHRSVYDAKAGWGRGIIWLAGDHSVNAKESFPDWSGDGHLVGALLHEIGHVFGCQHTQGTIMRSNLNELLAPGIPWPYGFSEDSPEFKAELELKKKMLSQIDFERELVNPRGGTQNLPDYDMNFALMENPINAEFVATNLLGRPASGTMTSRLTIESGKKLSDHKTFVLTISDSLGYESFAIAAPHLQGSSDSDSSTVQFYRSGEGFGSMLDLVESGVYEGLIQGRSGQSLPVVIYYNLNRQVHGGSPIKVSVRRDTDLLYLYRAAPGSTNQ